MITLISSDNESFEVSETVASLSTTISNMIKDGCAEGGIPLPNVTGSVLAKVLEYCNKHAAAATASEPSKADDDDDVAETPQNDADGFLTSAVVTPGNEDLRKFDEEFFIDVDIPMLLQIVSATN
ncbi:hypothetical protein PR202_gb28130 [Eleusine coracana subsp. coracana]|uniref:SKP1-like protein n=1 Tax=Eleusine coracana subsp. coracana TaxID=191504 RepID=A0AAV5FW72_ELECO|nr:hypothetical protein PR202_gb28130 [Eleusine coracana subsp. coracana]